MTIPIAPIAGLAAGLAEPARYLMTGDFDRAFAKLSKNYTGVDPRTGRFNFMDLSHGLLPLVGGMLVHKFVGGPPLNVNRMLAAAKVPFIRI